MTRGPLAWLRRAARLAGKLVLATVALGYIIVARSALFVLVLYLCLYFASGTSSVRVLLEQVIADALPGRVTMATLQWGPAPWRIRAAHVRITGVRGKELAFVPAVTAEMDLIRTLGSVFEKLAGADRPVEIAVNRARVTSPDVLFEVLEDGEIPFETALSPPGDPNAPPSYTRSVPLIISVRDALIEDADVDIIAPQVRAQLRGMRIPGSMTYTALRPFRAEVPYAIAARADGFLRPKDRPTNVLERLRFPMTGFTVRGFNVRDGIINLGTVDAGIDGGKLHVEGYLKTGQEAGWAATARVQLPGSSVILPEVFGGFVEGAIEARATGKGSFHRISVDLDATLSQAKLAGMPLGAMRLETQLSPVPGSESDPSPTHRLDVRSMVAQTIGGQVSIESASFVHRSEPWTAGIDEPVNVEDFDVLLRLEDVDPKALLTSPWFGLDDSSLPLERATLDGRVRLEGRLTSWGRHIELRAFTEGLTVLWAGERVVPLAERFSIDGEIRYMRQPPDVGPEPELLWPTERLHFQDFNLVSGADRARMDGYIDLSEESLVLRTDLRVADLGPLLEAFGVDGVGGQLRVDAGELLGTFRDPAVRANVRWSQARLDGADLGTIAARVSLDGGWLRLADATTSNELGRFSLSGKVRLWREGLDQPDPALPFVIDRIQVLDFPLSRLAPKLALKGDLSFRGSELAGTLADPLGTLTGRGTLVVDDITAFGERWSSARAEITGTPRRLKATSLEAVLTGELSSHTVTGTLDFDRASDELGATLTFQNLPLSALRAVRGMSTRVAGRVGGKLEIAGPLRRLVTSGSLRLREFEVGPVVLGNASLQLARAGGGRVQLVAKEHFEHVELDADSFIEFQQGLPGHIHLSARTTNAPLEALVPSLASPDIELRADAQARIDIFPLQPDRDPSIRLTAPVGGLRLDLLDEDALGYTNVTPVNVTIAGGGLTLDEVGLGRGDASRLRICGRMRADGRLAVEASGHVDLQLVHALEGMKDAFSAMEGRVELAGSGVRATCLRGQDGTVFALRGRSSAPVLVGRLQIPDARIQPRGLGQELRFARTGVELAADPRNPSRQLIRIPDDQRLSAEVGDGRLELAGEVTLERFALDTAKLRAVGSDVSYSSSGEWSATFNPDLTLAIQDFQSSKRRRMKLTGEVLVTEGRYFKSFDQLAQAFGAATGDAGTGGGGLSIVDEVPWLADLGLDLSVTSPTHTIEVASPFPFGKAELEARLALRVQGTLDDVKISDRIDFLEGGRIVYRVFARELELVSGTIEFTGDASHPRVDLVARSEIEYFERTASDNRRSIERQVVVYIRVAGVVGQRLDIEMWSEPGGFDKADLQSLLFFGKPLSGGERSLRDENVFTLDIARYFDQVLTSPFDYDLNVGPTAELRLDIETIIRFGPNLRLSARAIQESAESTHVQAGFTYRVSDEVSLEGTFDRTTGQQTDSPDAFEARVKIELYRD